MPVDPGRHWLEAGITGLARQREWDVVATAEAPGATGDEAEFVVLPDGRALLEGGPAGFDPTPLAASLEGRIDPPYRAVAVRRRELWVVGACTIDVVELSQDPGADTVEIVRTADNVGTRLDGLPSSAHLPELEGLGEARAKTYVVRAKRLGGALFEIEIEPL